jgi:hypothetical protein
MIHSAPLYYAVKNYDQSAYTPPAPTPKPRRRRRRGGAVG